MKISNFLKWIQSNSKQFVGISWQAPVQERKILYKFMQKLWNRHLLRPHGEWCYSEVIDSSNTIREEVTEALGEIPPESVGGKYLENIRAIIQEFQTLVENDERFNPNRHDWTDENKIDAEVPTIHPWTYMHLCPCGLPSLSFRDPDSVWDDFESFLKSDTAVGFGMEQGNVRLGELLLNLGLPSSDTDEVVLEEGTGGVAPGSLKMRFFLPGHVFYDDPQPWPDKPGS